jgi:hypothetical protein
VRSSNEGMSLPSLAEMPDEPSWYDWPPARLLHRVIPCSGDPRWFNPNIAGDPGDSSIDGRFHPFASAAEVRVPTLYAASSLTAAIAESLLHDLSLVPIDHPYTLSMAKVVLHKFSVMCFTSATRLIDLTGAGADRLRIPNELISWCPREEYPVTRAAARLLHTKYASAKGIRWTSRRYPPEDCVVLFGDRVVNPEAEISIIPPECRDLHEAGSEGYSALEAIIVEAGIVLTL